MSVVDASVVLKWFIEENDSDKARLLQDEYLSGQRVLVVPDLLVYEITNALRFNKTFNHKEINEVIDAFYGLGLEIHQIDHDLIKSAAAIAYESKLTVYDSIYIALALDLKEEFITADGEIQKKMGRKASVKLLKDF